MKLSAPKYSFCVFSQMLFLLCDLIFNCVILFPRSRDGLIVLFIFQDLFIVLSISMTMMMLFSTYLFQAGLVEVLFRGFRSSVLVSVIYLCVCVCWQLLWATDSGGPLRTLWAPGVLCAAHYCVCKHCALKVADPRLSQYDAH